MDKKNKYHLVWKPLAMSLPAVMMTLVIGGTLYGNSVVTLASAVSRANKANGGTEKIVYAVAGEAPPFARMPMPTETIPEMVSVAHEVENEITSYPNNGVSSAARTVLEDHRGKEREDSRISISEQEVRPEENNVRNSAKLEPVTEVIKSAFSSPQSNASENIFCDKAGGPKGKGPHFSPVDEFLLLLDRLKDNVLGQDINDHRPPYEEFGTPPRNGSNHGVVVSHPPFNEEKKDVPPARKGDSEKSISQISEKIFTQFNIAKDKLLEFLLGRPDDDTDNRPAEKGNNPPSACKGNKGKSGGDSVPLRRPSVMASKGSGAQVSGKGASTAIEKPEENWLDIFQQMLLEQKKGQQNKKAEK